MHNGQRRGCLCACLGDGLISISIWRRTRVSGGYRYNIFGNCLLGISAILNTELYVCVHPGDNNYAPLALTWETSGDVVQYQSASPFSNLHLSFSTLILCFIQN